MEASPHFSRLCTARASVDVVGRQNAQRRPLRGHRAVGGVAATAEAGEAAVEAGHGWQGRAIENFRVGNRMKSLLGSVAWFAFLNQYIYIYIYISVSRLVG